MVIATLWDVKQGWNSLFNNKKGKQKNIYDRFRYINFDCKIAKIFDR